jgi:hypothetical protein
MADYRLGWAVCYSSEIRTRVVLMIGIVRRCVVRPSPLTPARGGSDRRGRRDRWLVGVAVGGCPFYSIERAHRAWCQGLRAVALAACGGSLVLGARYLQ